MIYNIQNQVLFIFINGGIVQETIKEATVKGYGNKKHKMKIKKTSIGGYTFYELIKNDNIILLFLGRHLTKHFYNVTFKCKYYLT